MLLDREKDKAKHRIIGILHALKQFKEEGLIEDDTFYPDRAVEEVGEGMLKVAQRWYRIGARRGAIRLLKGLLAGNFSVRKGKGGSLSVIALRDNISWEKVLKVRVGNRTRNLPKMKYKLRVEDLGFQ
jgi:repressor of nif and glnA expression